MEIFGELERILAEDLYPYRWQLSIVALIGLSVAGWIAYRAGWIAALVRWARGRPVLAGVSTALILAVVLPTFWVLASPLWSRTTLIEDSPLAVAAIATATSDAMTATPTAEATETMTETVTATETMTETATETATGTPSADTTVAAVAADDAALPRLVLEGTWEGADDFHFAEGRVLIVETEPGVYILRVEDFSVRNGPDLFVYVSPDPAGYTAEAVKLGELKATDGAFNYEIPAGVTLDQMRSAVVWCDAFAVLFATAVLN